MCSDMGPPHRREEGLVFLSRRHIYSTVIQHECTRTHIHVANGIYILWAPYTLLHFIIMNTIYTRFTQHLCQRRLVQQIML
jgi:hypothetical protein